MIINDWGLFEVTRERVDFVKVHGIKNDPEILTKVLPYGTPTGRAVKHLSIEGKVYFSYIDMSSEVGKGLVFCFDRDQINLNLMDLLPTMENLVADPNQLDGPLTCDPQPRNPKPIKTKNFDSAVFAFLARLTTIVVGEEEEIFDLIYSVSAVVPPDMRLRLEFVTHSTSLSENVKIIGMPLSDEVLGELEGDRGSYTFIFPEDRVYGQYSSKISQKIANLVKKGDYDKVGHELEELYNIVRMTDELPPALELKDQFGIHLSDAQLILVMRANYFGKPVPDGLLGGGTSA